MHQADGLQPDLVTLAKALGGGLPMGATLAFGEAADLMTAGAHGSTFGGNPIAAAAALAVLDTIRDEGLLERAKELEHRFTAGIEGLGHAGISGVRGRGALLGVVLTADVAAALEVQLRAAGFLTNAVAPGVLRLAPPLVLTDAQVDAFVAALPAALDTALEETTS
jgi:acetylornithine/N-succinyldiaminopimelate aminotransferase